MYSGSSADSCPPTYPVLALNMLIGIVTPKLLQGFNSPRAVLDPDERAAKEAAQKGAGRLITVSGDTNIRLRKHAITEIRGISVPERVGGFN